MMSSMRDHIEELLEQGRQLIAKLGHERDLAQVIVYAEQLRQSAQALADAHSGAMPAEVASLIEERIALSQARIDVATAALAEQAAQN